jgi:hypothetical protein
MLLRFDSDKVDGLLADQGTLVFQRRGNGVLSRRHFR